MRHWSQGMACPFRVRYLCSFDFGRRKMDGVTFKHLQELAAGYEGKFPSELIKQDNFCCLNSQPRKISTSRIDEAFEDFLEGFNQKCFAEICRNEIQSDRIWL